MNSRAVGSYLGVRAEHVRVRWPEPPAKPPLADGALVTYLGRSGDTLVLYDFGPAKTTVRVPASLVTLADPDSGSG